MLSVSLIKYILLLLSRNVLLPVLREYVRTLFNRVYEVVYEVVKKGSETTSIACQQMTEQGYTCCEA